MAKPENLKSKTQPRIQRYFSEDFRRQKVEEMAIKARKGVELSGLIFHSDGGAVNIIAKNF